MRRRAAVDDLIMNGALLGAVVLTLVRPRVVARIAASPFVEKTINAISVRPGSPPPGARQHIAQLAARYSPRELRRRRALTRAASQQLNDSAAMLALSVLADSAVEHYRGSFQNKAMYAPLAVAALTIGGGLFGRFDPRGRKHMARDVIYGLAAATGLVGLGFHAYNILKRPGRLSWLNLFYSAPIGAPMALTLSGLLGRSAERIRDTRPSDEPTLLGLPAGRTLAAVTATGLAGTVGEAGLLHFRGRLPQPGDDAAGDGATNRFDLTWNNRTATGSSDMPAHETVAVADSGDRIRWRWLSRLRYLAQHGRLAELEPERS